ncbi:hypothetical protein N7465_000323, partial [Penicillium sp. CMV-2018d]
TAITASNVHCKCTPKDSCWPLASEWASLNATLSGCLIKTVPLGSVCYPSQPNYDPVACEDVIKNWTTSSFHSSDPSSIADPVSSNSSCTPIYPNGTSLSGDPDAGLRGCTLGNLSPYVINATEASHVQAALKFAKAHNLRLNIKNTGHNPDKSSAYGSLSIWTHAMKQFQFHESYMASSCPQTVGHMAATLGAGIQDGELFELLAQHNATGVGGTNTDVGVIGWATGGGHGFATLEYGMGADNIIEAVLVTPDGEVLTVNQCQNEELYWAIRGGGGGTFGVILSVTVKAYPMPSVTMIGLDLTARNGTTPRAWWKLIAEVHKELAVLQDSGIGGYWTISGPPFHFGHAMFQYNTSSAESADQEMLPLKKLLDHRNGTVSSNITKFHAASWYNLTKIFPQVEHTGTSRSARTSRLIPRRAIEDTRGFAYILEKIGPQPDNPKNAVSNPSMSGTMTPGKKMVDNSLNPAWREAVVHLITSQSWNDSLPDSVAAETYDRITNEKGYLLRQIAPDSGAYYNEADRHEPNWQWSFWGPHYTRLREIKQMYDPQDLLWCHHCVGSEGWIQEKNGTLCRVP